MLPTADLCLSVVKLKTIIVKRRIAMIDGNIFKQEKLSGKILGINKGLGRRAGKSPQKLIQDYVAICFPVHPHIAFHPKILT